MSQGLTVITVRISAHVHSTENIRLVKLAIGKAIPAINDDLEKLVKVTSVAGDYGNPIKVISCMLEHKARIGAFLKHAATNLPRLHKVFLNGILERVYSPETSTIFLRLHKQLLFKDRFCISLDDDIVHVTMKFTSFGARKQGIPKEDASGTAGHGSDIDRVRAFLLERGILE